MIQPMAVAVVWVVVLLGSVELAASACILWVYACMWGDCRGGGMHALMHSQLHTLMHSHVCPSEGQSLHDSVQDCDIHLFLIKENDANRSTMFRDDYFCTICHANFKFRDFFVFRFKIQHLDRHLFFLHSR